MLSEQMDLLALLQEQTGPRPCPHANVGMKTGGWTLEHNKRSPYYREWVHANPRCRRSRFPGMKQGDTNA